MAKPRESSSPKPKKPAAATNGHHPTHEQIALRAYHIYLERGAAPGNELADWTRAEHELIAEAVAQKTGRKPAPKPLKSIATAA